MTRKTNILHICPLFFFLGSNPHVNAIVSSESNQVSHWNIDVEQGKWTQSGFEKCNGESAWFGWKKSQKVGQINTKLYGTGFGKLTFGNCGDTGDVSVYLGNVLLGSAAQNEKKSIEFDFEHESTLKLIEERGGFNSPKIQIFEFQIISSMF